MMEVLTNSMVVISILQYQINTFNLHNIVCQLYLNKLEKMLRLLLFSENMAGSIM